jgi:hypothetical protein
MKNNIAKTTLFSLIAAALVAVPSVSRAADATNPPAATTPAPKKHGGIPFHGKVVAVDTNAMTFTVGTMTIAITSETKITKDDQPAVFADITVGEAIRGSYKKDDAGKLNATTVRIGENKKQKSAASA